MKPRRCELYRHFDKDNRLLYVGISYSALSRLMEGHRSQSHWFDDIVRVEIERYPTRKDAEKAELEAIGREKPLHNLITDTKRGITSRAPEWQALIDRVGPLIEAAGYEMRSKGASYLVYDAVWNAIRRGQKPPEDCVKPSVNRKPETIC
jgi:hypothetical protein